MKSAESQSSTRACVVLDPSGTLNQNLLKAPNLEQKIQDVMRKIQSTPVLVSMDIKEAFFRITLVPESTNLSLFFMDLNTKTNELTAKVGPDTKLVTIRSLVTIMGFLQSLSFLHLCLDSLTNDIRTKSSNTFSSI